MNSYQQAINFLEKYIPTPDKKHPGELGLTRMKYLMELLGNPQLKYSTIHVGGTSGKGSTATFIASVLATKYKVGLHTSPHLVRISERIKILKDVILRPKAKESRTNVRKQVARSFASLRMTEEGTNISDRDFIELVNYIKPFIEKVGESKFGAPSYFEIIAALGFYYFYMQKVDIAVIEVGMGGRYDATNVIQPLVAVITNVGLDHTEVLGDTVERIAEDKAGIIKPGIEVVSGATQQSVIDIISAKCKAQGAKLSLLVPPPSGESLYAGHPRGVFTAFNYRVRKLNSDGSVFDYKGDNLLKDLRIGLLGEHQVENAALAVRVTELLNYSGSNEGVKTHFSPDIKQGLLNAYIPGRLEIIRRNPLMILDGAHNQDKVRALVSSIKKIFPGRKIISIIAIKNDKKSREMLAEILKLSKKIIFTEFELKADVGVIKSYAPLELLGVAKKINSNKPMIIIEDAKKAVKDAVKSAKVNDLILVTGSLYLVGEIKKYANKQINK